MNEDEIIKILNDYIKSPYKCDNCKYCSGQRNTQKAIEEILDLYQKEKEKNKKWERKWDEEKYLIKLAENELLGYIQGYEDGFYHNSTAVQQVIKNRESEIHQLEIERLKKIISKLKKENEELDQKFKYAVPDEIVDELYVSKDKIREKIEELDIEIQQCQYADDDIEEYKNDMEKEKSRLLRDKKILQELLEENNAKQM